MTQHSPTITVMLNAVRKATKALIRDFGELENLQVSRKGTSDFVTAADLKAEKILMEELQKARPKYGFLTEESGVIKGSDESHRWIIDPLDGTINFMHGSPLFCCTVALERTNHNGSKEIIAAVTESPIYNEVYWAEKGLGAWVDGGNTARRLRVAARNKFNDSLFCVGTLKNDIPLVNKLISLDASGVRAIGSTALSLAYTAAGSCDAFVKGSAHLWDIAAGILLVREAGGVVTTFEDKSDLPEGCSIVAANDKLQMSLIKEFRQR